MLLRCDTAILNQLAGKAQPPLAVKRADLHAGIGLNLTGDAFAFPRLDVQPALKQINRAERADPRLAAFHGGERICPALFQEFVNLLHMAGTSFSGGALLTRERRPYG